MHYKKCFLKNNEFAFYSLSNSGSVVFQILSRSAVTYMGVLDYRRTSNAAFSQNMVKCSFL